jgi:hypothetical protein
MPSRFQTVAFEDFSEPLRLNIWNKLVADHEWRVGPKVSRVAQRVSRWRWKERLRERSSSSCRPKVKLLRLP